MGFILHSNIVSNEAHRQRLARQAVGSTEGTHPKVLAAQEAMAKVDALRRERNWMVQMSKNAAEQRLLDMINEQREFFAFMLEETS